MSLLLSHLVDRAADRAPDHDAFRAPGERLTYGELTERSNRLAHLLVDEGVEPGDRVGILMPRLLESAVAVYGILKAGAAFVPIDPYVPVGGLVQLIEGCGIRHLTVDPSRTKTVELLAGKSPTLETVVGLEAPLGNNVRTHPWADLAQYDAGESPDIRVQQEDLAYIMYSSGSTGRPKGIMHSHRSGLSYAELSVKTYGVNADDRIGNHSPLHFDMSTFGYFSSPLAGATTLLVPEAYTKLTASLSQLMESEQLTIWYSVPLALIQLLLRGVLESRDLSSLRWVLFGGEPFARKHIHGLMKAWPQARFSNVYGPAEVNQCTFYHVPGPEDHPGRDLAEPVPIGRTWEDTEGLIVGADDCPVEDGEVGELLIASPTMMRGYWARPDLDNRSFLRRRVGDRERIFYRTGDLVRTLEDGNLLFLGRKDRQVKVRGYRVELDDIERTLSSHAKIEEAAVFPVRVSGEVQHLEAEVILRPGMEAEPDELRDHLADLLSWYAVPAKTRIVESFPRTSSGKIDRRRLQATAEDAIG